MATTEIIAALLAPLEDTMPYATTVRIDTGDVLANKGDIIVHNGELPVRLAAGDNGEVLIADSTAATGLKWGTPTESELATILTAAGQLITFDGEDPVALTVGDDGQVLLADSGAAAGVAWGAIPDQIAALLTAPGDLITLDTDTPAVLTVGDDGQVLIADSNETSGLRWGTPDPAPRWTVIDAARYTATPSNATTIAMSDTSGLAAGMPVRYSFDGGTHYGIITAVTTDTSIAISGVALDTEEDLTELAIGSPEMVRQVEYTVSGTYGDGAVATLLATDMGAYSRWQGPAARVVRVSAVHAVADGTANPKVNPSIGGTSVLLDDSGDGVQLSTAGTWVNGASVDPANAAVAFGDAIEIECTAAGTDGDAEDLTVQLVLVLI